MTICSTAASDTAGPASARTLVETRTGRAVHAVTRLAGGANNRLYRVDRDAAPPCVVKFYARVPVDPRDRLGTEFGALTFLWRGGLRVIPEPIAFARDVEAGIYGFVDGTPFPTEPVGEEGLAAVADFLQTLGAIGRRTPVPHAPLASEACFSGHDAIAALSLRLARHMERASEPRADPAYRHFLETALVPGIEAVVRRSIPRLAAAGLDTTLPTPQRALSPSDLGFHNMLRRPDGTAAFLDFEYFGWDDPAKTIADFLLHPAMTLDERSKRSFVRLCLDRLAHPERVAARLGLLYPLCALKWCFILLNEFLPEFADRRRFLDPIWNQTREDRQIARAADTLADAEASLEDFSLAA